MGRRASKIEKQKQQKKWERESFKKQRYEGDKVREKVSDLSKQWLITCNLKSVSLYRQGLSWKAETKWTPKTDFKDSRSREQKCNYSSKSMRRDMFKDQMKVEGKKRNSPSVIEAKII